MPATCTTLGTGETKTIDLARGTDPVTVNPKLGYLGATSAAVRSLS